MTEERINVVEGIVNVEEPIVNGNIEPQNPVTEGVVNVEEPIVNGNIETPDDVEEPKIVYGEVTNCKEPKIVYGEVTNCKKLNVRTAPTLKATSKMIVNENDIVEIIESESTDEWFRVCTENGVKGYCMRRYITRLS